MNLNLRVVMGIHACDTQSGPFARILNEILNLYRLLVHTYFSAHIQWNGHFMIGLSYGTETPKKGQELGECSVEL